MSLVRKVHNLFLIERDRPELLVAQANAFSRQIPMLYAVLLANTVALSVTHFKSAPAFLTVVGPVLLALGCGGRLVRWWRLRDQALEPDQAFRLLRQTVWLSPVLGLLFTFWSLALYPYGDAYQRGHIAFFMGITVVACVFCLMHLRAAALIASMLVAGPMILFFAVSGERVFEAIAFNMLLAGGAMIIILQGHYREFSDLISSRTAVARQMEEARRLSEENDRLANLDSLTTLPNRRRFFREVDAYLARARTEARGLWVGVLDLDGFKPINDAFGHATGDRLLIEVGRRLEGFAPDRLFVARLGGDEFGLILDAGLNPAEAQAMGRELCALLRAPFDLPGIKAQVGASIGFCPFPDGGERATQLFERADYALYHAKQTLKGAAVLFDERHEATIRQHSRVERALAMADIEAEMRVVFQPIVDAPSGRTLAFEALARWRSPVEGDVPPGVFIDAAERSGQIVEITRVLVAKTLRTMHGWPMDLRVSINLSARDIASMDAVERLIEIVRQSRIAPHRIDFEITETGIVSDFEQARAALAAFKELGVRTVLDDFGTGHSSLSHVRLLPLDKLKVDASFVTDIESHQASQDIVKTVLQLCQNLRFDCVVEGVETEGQRDQVIALGGALMQGYLFARPMAAEAVPGYLTAETLKTLGRAEPSQAPGEHHAAQRAAS